MDVEIAALDIKREVVRTKMAAVEAEL